MESQTEEFVFSLGVSPLTQINRQEKKKKRKAHNSHTSRNNRFDFFSPIFSIVPDSYYPSRIMKMICSVAPFTMKEQIKFCELWEKSPYPPSSFTSPFDDLPKVFWSPTWGDEAAKILVNIRGLRWVFRRFLHRWRVSKLQLLNTEDIVTCEVPIHPIFLVDWSKKQKWVFEASTLLRDITNRLQHNDGFFEQPQQPRNPLTNLPLTHSQVISVWNQLQNVPIAKSQVYTAFRASRMNVTTFRFDYRIPLQLHALRTTMAEFTHYDAIERLLDFMDIAFDRQGTDFDLDTWNYVVRHFPNHEVILRWRALCLRYYEMDLRYDCFPEHREQQQNKIWSLTFPLLHKQDEMATLVPVSTQEEELVANILSTIQQLQDLQTL